MKIEHLESLANAVLDLCHEVRYLRQENGRLRAVEQEYREHVNSEIQFHHQNMANWIDVFMKNDISPKTFERDEVRS